MDMLERLEPAGKQYDVDVVLLYGEGQDPAAVAAKARELMADGESVLVQRSLPVDIRFRRLVNMEVAEC
jgi:hypothetical protein